MPLPIDIMEQALGQSLNLFRDCFSQPQWQHFVTGLLALRQCEDHRTLSALLRKIAGVGSRVDGLSHVFKHAPGQTKLRVTKWWGHYGQVLGPLVVAEPARQRARRPKRRGRPRKTVVTGLLIVDDPTHEKPKGKKMEGLGRHYSSSAKKTVKGPSLFASLAVLLGRLVLERGWAITGGRKANRTRRLVDRLGRRAYRSLAESTARLTDTDFPPVEWPHAAGSSRLVYAHRVKTFVKKLGACQVLIVRARLDQPRKDVRSWATSDLAADLPTVVGWVAHRWTIEPFSADVKEVFGTDHYGVPPGPHSASGIVRFWHLAFLGYRYLAEQRAKRPAAPDKPELPIGQTRYAEGLTSEQMDQLLAA